MEKLHPSSTNKESHLPSLQIMFLPSMHSLQEDFHDPAIVCSNSRSTELVVAAEPLGESNESVIEAESSHATIPCMLVEEGDADVLERGIVVKSPVFTYMYNSAAPLNSEDNKETSESKTKVMTQYQFLGSVCPTSAEALDNAVVFHVSSVVRPSVVDDPPFLSLDELKSTSDTFPVEHTRLVDCKLPQQQNCTNNKENEKVTEKSECVSEISTSSLKSLNHVHRLVKMLPSLSGDDAPLIVSDEDKKIIKLQQDVTASSAEDFFVEKSFDDVVSISSPDSLLAFRTVVKRATSTGQLQQPSHNTLAELYPICELKPTIDFPSYQMKESLNHYLPQASMSESSSVCTESTDNSSSSPSITSDNLRTAQPQQHVKLRPTLSRQFKSSDRLLQEAVQYSEALGEKPPRTVDEISREIIDPEDDEGGSDDDDDDGGSNNLDNDAKENISLRLPCTTTLNDCHNSFSSSSFFHVEIDQNKSREFPSVSYNEGRELGIQATSDIIKILPNTSCEQSSCSAKATEHDCSPQQDVAEIAVLSLEVSTSSQGSFRSELNLTPSVEQQNLISSSESLNINMLKHQCSMEDNSTSRKDATSSLQLCISELMPLSTTSHSSARSEFFYKNIGCSNNNLSVHSLGKYMLNPQPRSTTDSGSSSSYLGVKYHPPEITRGNYAQLHRKAWLEVSDKYHRYGKNLRLYYKHWNSLGHPFNMFFDWLDSKGEAAGQPLPNLPECPRSQLDSDTVLYITDPDVQDLYQLRIASRGEERLGYVLDANGKPVLTGEEGWIFVLRDGKFYGAKKVTETAGLSKKRFHHSSFFAGKSVTAAGIFITKEEGRILCMYPHSGHYRPGEAHMQRLLYYLQRLGIDLNTFDVDVQQIAHVARKEVVQTILDESNPDQKVEKRRKEKKADSLYLTPASHVACFLTHKAKMLSKGVFGQIQNVRQVRAASVQEALDAVDNGGYWKQKNQKEASSILSPSEIFMEEA
jgi:hypothetical protein